MASLEKWEPSCELLGRWVRDQVPMLTVDRELRVRYANQGFCQLAGFEEADVIGGPVQMVSSLDPKASLERRVADVIGGKLSSGCDICCRSKDGSTFWMAGSLVALRGAGDAIDGVAVIGVDKSTGQIERTNLSARAAIVDSLVRGIDLDEVVFDVLRRYSLLVEDVALVLATLDSDECLKYRASAMNGIAEQSIKQLAMDGLRCQYVDVAQSTVASKRVFASELAGLLSCGACWAQPIRGRNKAYYGFVVSHGDGCRKATDFERQVLTDLGLTLAVAFDAIASFDPDLAYRSIEKVNTNLKPNAVM